MGLTQTARFHRATKHHRRKKEACRRQQQHQEQRESPENQEQQNRPSISRKSSSLFDTVLNVTVDDEEEKKRAEQLRRFLFMGDGGENGDDNDNDCVVSLKNFDAIWYSLYLEPVEIQNDRCIMFFECFSIYGALLVAVMWVIYEYRYMASDAAETTLDRVFDGIAAAALLANIFLTVFGSWFWGTSILTNSGNAIYLWSCMGPMKLISHLQLFTTNLIVIETILGIWIYHRGRIIEQVILTTMSCLLLLIGNGLSMQLMIKAIPLEMFHCPTILLCFANPSFVFTQSGKDQIRSLAIRRANTLKQKYNLIVVDDDDDDDDDGNYNMSSSDNNLSTDVVEYDDYYRDWDSIDDVLRAAMKNLNRDDDDIVASTKIFRDKLDAEWLTEVRHLRGMSAESLNKYMPLRLAKEVEKLVAARKKKKKKKKKRASKKDCNEYI